MSSESNNPGTPGEGSQGKPEGAASGKPSGESFDVLLADVPVELSVELGRVVMSLREVGARLGPGSIIPLSKLTGDKLDVRINERLVARAEAVAIGERYGARIVEIVRDEKESGS